MEKKDPIIRLSLVKDKLVSNFLEAVNIFNEFLAYISTYI